MLSIVLYGESRPRRDGGGMGRSVVLVVGLVVGWALLACSQAQADLHATAVSVDCGPGVAVSQSATCTATITDNAEAETSPPSGTVNFTSDAEGAFSPATTCEPTPSGEAQSSCSVEYTPTAVGTQEITGAYGGDSMHAESSGSGTLPVTLRTTTVSVDCGSGVVVAQSATCTATVTDNAEGTPSAPSGTVNFTSDVSGASFGLSGSCALTPLSSGAQSGCSVEYHSGQAAPRVHSITAAYGADTVHAASSASGTLTVKAAPAASQSGGTTTTTTTTTAPAPVVGAAPGTVAARVTPKCRVRARERWKLVGGPKRRHKLEVPQLLVTYTCDQSAAVRVGGAVRIAAVRHKGKLTRPRTVKLATVSSQAVLGRAQPGVVLAVPATVVKALRKGVRAEATVTFTVKNANGTGVGTIKFLILPPARVTHKRG
jgi:hypothetical protein